MEYVYVNDLVISNGACITHSSTLIIHENISKAGIYQRIKQNHIWISIDTQHFNPAYYRLSNGLTIWLIHWCQYSASLMDVFIVRKKNMLLVKLAFEMSMVHRQQHSFSTPEHPDVLAKVSNSMRQEIFRPEGNSKPQPSDSRPTSFMFRNTDSIGIDILFVKLKFGTCTVYRQLHSFSTHERMSKCQSFWVKKCLGPMGIWTPNLYHNWWIFLSPAIARW